MNFGKALEAVKGGKKITRKGWNGKGQYVIIVTDISCMSVSGEIITPNHNAIGNKCLAFVGTSGIQLGWLASQSDMLAEDWEIIE